MHFIILKLLIKIGLTVRPLIYSEKVCVCETRNEERDNTRKVEKSYQTVASFCWIICQPPSLHANESERESA